MGYDSVMILALVFPVTYMTSFLSPLFNNLLCSGGGPSPHYFCLVCLSTMYNLSDCQHKNLDFFVETKHCNRIIFSWLGSVQFQSEILIWFDIFYLFMFTSFFTVIVLFPILTQTKEPHKAYVMDNDELFFKRKKSDSWKISGLPHNC